MQNRDIDEFFAEADLTDCVARQDQPPVAFWEFRGLGFPMIIQTQEAADRMRIVAFIGDAGELSGEQMQVLLEANYHSALDARYAVTDGHLVSVFLHPFEELSETQFILGLFQVINCAATCGTTFSGGTMVFGTQQEPPMGTDGANLVDEVRRDIRGEVIAMIRGGDEE